MSVDASRLLAELRVNQAELQEQNIALRLARDAAEAALADYTDLYDSAPVGVASVGVDGEITAANQTLATLLGVDRGQLTGHRLSLWVVPEDRATVAELLARARDSDLVECIEIELARAEASRVTVSLSASRVAGGTALRLAFTDVMRQRVAERALQQTQMMAAIGLLAGRIADEMNNLLTVISVHNGMMLTALADGGAGREDAVSVGKAVDRARLLTTSLMAFARPQALARQSIDVDEAVAAFAQLVSPLLSANLHVVTLTGAPGAVVSVDPVQFDQILMSFALNAADAMPNGGRLEFATAVVELDAERLTTHPGIDPGSFVRIRVRDTGHGMDAEVARRVFEPFFTTKAPGKGTGLGLAMVYAITHQSGGFVTATSVLDGGATFDVHLRRARSHPEQIHQTPIVEVGPTRGMETILVVDDEPLLLRIITRQLEQLGYICKTAVDGADALRTALVLGDTVDLVLTDFLMPNMSGPEFVRSLHEAHPAIPVVFMTGFETTVELDEAAVPPHAGVLHKPFTGAALGAIVRRTLDRNASTP